MMKPSKKGKIHVWGDLAIPEKRLQPGRQKSAYFKPTAFETDASGGGGITDAVLPHTQLSLQDNENLQTSAKKDKTDDRPVYANVEYDYLEPLALDEEIILQHKFQNYATEHFQEGSTSSFDRVTLQQPLLAHIDYADQTIALAIWIVILRYMKEIAEPVSQTSEGNTKIYKPIMNRLQSSVGRKFNKDDFEKARYMALDLMSDNKHQTSGSPILSSEPMPPLEKVQFIIGCAILRSSLRDEVYCQVCKQLTENPNEHSQSRGWILLCLCAASFVPSERFKNYLWCFIKEGPPIYSDYAARLLQRTYNNGVRTHPPSFLELQSVASNQPLVLPVLYPDGSKRTLAADPATTAKEMCQQLAEKVQLTDRFGFTLHVNIFDEMSSLGNGDNHVMDAVALCEQIAKQRSGQERNAPWSLHFRKEIFAAWDDFSNDDVATDLIYHQVVRGVRNDEYYTENDADLALMAAQQYYVTYGRTVLESRLQSLIPTYLPESRLQGERFLKYWLGQIVKVFEKTGFSESRWLPKMVKERVVRFARHAWPLYFSRSYKAFKFTGPVLPTNDVIIGVSWKGVHVLDQQERLIKLFTFPEITALSYRKSDRNYAQIFTLATVQGDDYTFTSPFAAPIGQLAEFFFSGLKRRSRYAIALQDIHVTGDASMGSLQKGDVVILDRPAGESLLISDTCSGERLSTGDTVQLSSTSCYVLPCLSEPASSVVRLYKIALANSDIC